MMINGGLVSLIYPFAVFGYAILQEDSPKKNFWNFIMVYTCFVILLKVVAQLVIWPTIFVQAGGDYDEFVHFCETIHLGIFSIQSKSVKARISIFIPELLVLFSVVTH